MPKALPKQTFRAIVLQVRNAGEGHQVVDAWLHGQGRLGLWARHARASRKRFGSALAPFAELQIEARPANNLWTIEAAVPTVDRLAIRNNLAAIGRAATLCRLVQALWPQGQDCDQLFESLTVALDHLAAGNVARAAGLYPRLLMLAGLMPSTERCRRCDKPLDEAAAAYTSEPALVCTRCAPRDVPLSAEALHGLRGQRVQTEQAAAAIEALTCHWVSHFSGRRIAPWSTELLP